MKAKARYEWHKNNYRGRWVKGYIRKRTCKSICIDKKIQQEFELEVLKSIKEYANKIHNWRNESTNSTMLIG